MVFYVTPSLPIVPLNMLSFSGLVVFAAVLQVISSQGPPFPNLPEECRHPPPNARPHECCDIPPILDESKLAACGIEKPSEENPLPGGPPDCSKGLCILKNEGLLDDNEKLKYKEIGSFLDNWTKDYPEFGPAIEFAKGQCIKEGGPPGPPQICEADRFLFCITGNIFFKCPKWKDSDNCKQLQEHMEKCDKFFVNPQ